MNWRIYSNGASIRAVPYDGPAPDDSWQNVGTVKDEELDFEAVDSFIKLYALPTLPLNLGN